MTSVASGLAGVISIAVSVTSWPLTTNDCTVQDRPALEGTSTVNWYAPGRTSPMSPNLKRPSAEIDGGTRRSGVNQPPDRTCSATRIVVRSGTTSVADSLRTMRPVRRGQGRNIGERPTMSSPLATTSVAATRHASMGSRPAASSRYQSYLTRGSARPRVIGRRARHRPGGTPANTKAPSAVHRCGFASPAYRRRRRG